MSISQALDLIALDSLTDAEIALVSLEAANSQNPDYWYAVALLLTRRGDDRARDAIDRALACYPLHSDTRALVCSREVFARSTHGDLPDVAFVVLTTRRYHDTRARAVRETWGAKVARLMFATDCEVPNDPTFIRYPLPESYLGGSLKNVLALQHLGRAHPAAVRWVMVCDDDTFVFPEKLGQVLASLSSDDPICIGHVLGHFSELPDLRYPSGGAGFVVSRAALPKLTLALNDTPIYKYGDVTVGVALQRAGIALHHSEFFWSQSPAAVMRDELKNGRALSVRDQVSFHYLSPAEMRELHSST